MVRATSRGIYDLTTAPLEYTNTKTTQNGPFIFGISPSGGATCKRQGPVSMLRKQHGSINPPHLLGFNSDMEAYEHGLELHDVKVFGMVN